MAKDIRQRIEEGEFSQSAEISASYLDEDLLIINDVKVLAHPDPVRLQMNMIASCLRGRMRLLVSGKTEVEIHAGQVFVCPPNSTLDLLEFSDDFECQAVCLTQRGLQGVLRSHINVWNRAMYVDKVSVIHLSEAEMNFYDKFTELVRLCLSADFSEQTLWKPYRREIVETLLKSAMLALCHSLTEQTEPAAAEPLSTTNEIFDRFLEILQQSEVKHHPVEYFARQLCITPKYLSVVCKRHSDKTAIEWITEYTLADISYYLRSTNKSIKEIAVLLGFTNTSFFGKYVREHFHMSPLKYRASMR